LKILKSLILCLSLFCCSITIAQNRDDSVKLKHGLPNILKVTSVRVYSDSPTSAEISVWIAIKSGKIVNVSRDKGDWIITLRTRGQVSTYVVAEKSFKVIGQESKAENIRALHFTEA